MLMKQIINKPLNLSTKAKGLLELSSIDFFIRLNSIIGMSTHKGDYIEEINGILTALYNQDIVEMDFDEKYDNGIFKIKGILVDEPIILKQTKEHLLRPRKKMLEIIDLTTPVTESPAFTQDYDFDSLVALKYLQKKQQAESRGIEFKLTLNDVKRLMKTKRCYYSGVELTLLDDTHISFDRKDSSVGYTVENTVACASIVNALKNSLIEDHKVVKILSNKEIKKMLISFSELF